MRRLFFSIINSNSFLAIQNNDRWIISDDNKDLSTERFIISLKKILDSNSFKLSQIEEVFFISGPGRFSGIRLSMTFVLTLQSLNPKLKIYHLDSLTFQAGDEDCISSINKDKKGDKNYVAIFNQEKKIFVFKIYSQKEIEEIAENTKLLLKKNFENINFITNIEKLKKKFVVLETEKAEEIIDKWTQ